MSVEQLSLDLADFETALSSAKTQRLKGLLTSGIAAIKRDIAIAAQPREPVAVAQPPQPSAVSSPPKLAATFQDVKAYSWDESDASVKIYVTLEGCGKIEEKNVSLNCQELSAQFKLLAPKPQALMLRPLKKKIVPERCTVKCKQDSVVLTLVKADKGKWWDLLEKTADRKAQGGGGLDDAGGKDKGEEDPGASIMNMMKKLYDEGDADMKRTIAKAWTESKEKQARGETI